MTKTNIRRSVTKCARKEVTSRRTARAASRRHRKFVARRNELRMAIALIAITNQREEARAKMAAKKAATKARNALRAEQRKAARAARRERRAQLKCQQKLALALVTFLGGTIRPSQAEAAKEPNFDLHNVCTGKKFARNPITGNWEIDPWIELPTTPRMRQMQAEYLHAEAKELKKQLNKLYYGTTVRSLEAADDLHKLRADRDKLEEKLAAVTAEFDQWYAERVGVAEALRDEWREDGNNTTIEMAKLYLKLEEGYEIDNHPMVAWHSKVEAKLMHKIYNLDLSICHLEDALKSVSEDKACDYHMRKLAENALKEHAPRQKPAKEARQMYHYRTPVMTLRDVVPADILEAMGQVKNNCDPDAMAVIEDYISKLEMETSPIWVDGSTLEWRDKIQNEVTDILGIESGERTTKLITLDHDLGGEFIPMENSEQLKKLIGVPARKNGIRYESKGFMRIVDAVTALSRVWDRRGFNVKFGNETPNVQYTQFNVSSSGAKSGVWTFMAKTQYKEHWKALTLGVDFASVETNGETQQKILALLSTPSAIYEIPHPEIGENVCERIHLSQIIMCDTLTLEIKCPDGAIKYGEGSYHVTLPFGTENRKVDIPVTLSDGKVHIHSMDGWDGVILANIKSCANFQARCKSLKGMVLNVHSMLEQLKDVPGYEWLNPENLVVKDLSGRDHKFLEGTLITTPTTWKAHKWFHDDWELYTRCCAELAKVYDGYDCLRAAAIAEEYDFKQDERHLARQLVQQLLTLSPEMVAKLMEKDVHQAKSLNTYHGAWRHLAGIGKPEEELTQLEWLFRLVPGLAATENVGKYCHFLAMDRLADALCCRIKSPEICSFLMQDPVAMLEALTGREVKGRLQAGECCIPGVADGVKVAGIRYPGSGSSVKVFVNRVIPEFQSFGNVCIINIHDPWIILNDGDCDGDHIALYLGLDIVAAVEELERVRKILKLDAVVEFPHGAKGAVAKPTAEWMSEGRVKYISNGLLFNKVGIFSQGATRAWSVASEKMNQGKQQYAGMWGVIGNLFYAASILTIDWAKEGVPTDPSDPGRRIYDAANEIIGWSFDQRGTGKYFGTMPFAQAFRDHGKKNKGYFWENLRSHLSMSGKSVVHNYARPTCCTIDTIAKEGLRLAGIGVYEDGEILEDTLAFDRQDGEFLWETLAWVESPRNPRKGVVDSATLKSAMPGIIKDASKSQLKLDAEIAANIMQGNPVGIIEFLKFCWRYLGSLAAKAARESVVSGGVRMKMFSEQKRAAYAIIRSIVHDMCQGEPWVYEKDGVEMARYDDIEDRYQLVIDVALGNALRLGSKGPNVGAKDDTEEQIAEKEGKYAMYILEVFAPDLLERAELLCGAAIRHCDATFIDYNKVEDKDEDGIFVVCEYEGETPEEDPDMDFEGMTFYADDFA